MKPIPPNARYGPAWLTVIIRDDSPLIHSGDRPTYRTVRVRLTDDQRAELALLMVAGAGGHQFHEQVSQAILDEDEDEVRP